jgi:two-component system nitrate/nitrite response regulator NarL
MNTGKSAIILDRANLLRDGLKEALRGCSIDVVAEGESFADMFSIIDPAQPPDLVICGIDVMLGSASVHDAIGTFRQQVPAARIVVLAGRATPATVAIAAEAGADAFLLTDISKAALEHSIELVLLGQQLFPAPARLPRGLNPMPTHPSARAPDPLFPARDLTAADEIDVPLSPRERQIVQCLVTGLSNKAIARELQITEATVKVHVTNLMRKISAANRTQLAIWAVDKGFQLARAARLEPARM